MEKCKELRVYTDTMNGQNEVISRLSDALLNDPYFYFLHEARFVVIRTTEKYMKSLLKHFLSVNKDPVRVFEVDDYVEWNNEVIKNESIFSKIMHEASLLRISGNANHEIFERIVHCTFNIIGDNIYNDDGKQTSESSVMYRLLHDRVYTEGVLRGAKMTDEELKACGLL
jgi:hypothetical protein